MSEVAVVSEVKVMEKKLNYEKEKKLLKKLLKKLEVYRNQETQILSPDEQ